MSCECRCECNCFDPILIVAGLIGWGFIIGFTLHKLNII